MKPEEVAAHIAHHEEMMDYELANATRAREVGSPQSEERSTLAAATHASILTELRRRLPVDTSRGEQIILAVLKGNRKMVRDILGIGGPK
jgi:hypothetical protein